MVAQMTARPGDVVENGRSPISSLIVYTMNGDKQLLVHTKLEIISKTKAFSTMAQTQARTY